jgi:hypothetical protein
LIATSLSENVSRFTLVAERYRIASQEPLGLRP